MVLYGLGTTVGAGIYALVGEIAGVSGYLAPWAFLTAALLAGFTAYSYAQLSARFPRAAGAALYVEEGLRLKRLALLVGMLVVVAGVVSSAALLNGFVGYLQQFIALERAMIILIAGVLLCAVALWGISESVWVAGTISIVEVLGLVWITILAAQAADVSHMDVAVFVPNLAWEDWSAVFAGAVLAFYAYIGFEDMVEVAEEVKDVRKNLPRAIMLTLVLSTIIYIGLICSTVLAVGPERLAQSTAPLADVYRHLTGDDPSLISFIGLFAIINGALIQVIMASRVIYGLASRGHLPGVFARVNQRTRTPVPATLSAGAAVVALALTGTLAGLAELTAVTMLCVFALVNFSLCRLLWADKTINAILGFAGGLICTAFAGRTVYFWLI
jgi:amino acid transporter